MDITVLLYYVGKDIRHWYLYEYIPYSVFSEVLMLLLQRIKMLSQWRTLDQLHHDVQLVA